MASTSRVKPAELPPTRQALAVLTDRLRAGEAVTAADVAEAEAHDALRQLRSEAADQQAADAIERERQDRIGAVRDSLLDGHVADLSAATVTAFAHAVDALVALAVAADSQHQAIRASIVELKRLQPLDGITLPGWNRHADGSTSRSASLDVGGRRIPLPEPVALLAEAARQAVAHTPRGSTIDRSRPDRFIASFTSVKTGRSIAALRAAADPEPPDAA